MGAFNELPPICGVEFWEKTIGLRSTVVLNYIDSLTTVKPKTGRRDFDDGASVKDLSESVLITTSTGTSGAALGN